MRARRHIAAAALAAAGTLVLALPGAASAAYVDEVAEAWADDPVYVDDDAREALSQNEERALEEQIAEGEEPVYVAVLPEEAREEGGGTTVGLLQELAQEQGSNATYAAIVGGQFRAGSTDGLPASQLSARSFSEHRSDGADAVLEDFVARVQQARATGDTPGSGSGAGDGGGGGGFGLIIFLLLFVGLPLFFFMRVKKRITRAFGGGGGRGGGYAEPAYEQPSSIDHFEADELRDVQRAAHSDMVALGEDLRTMDIEIQLPKATPEAKRRYSEALDAYQKVSAAIDEADTLQELRPLSREIARGRYSLDCARALLDGRPEPEPRVACFFDPRHGTSVRDVPWIGPNDEPLDVPACEICADRVEAGRQPDTRRVEVQGREMPYYDAPQMGGYYGGFFGGGGGGGTLLTGLMLGNLLGGGGLFGGHSHGSWHPGDFGGGGGFGGGGDFGGDFGGGGDF